MLVSDKRLIFIKVQQPNIIAKVIIFIPSIFKIPNYFNLLFKYGKAYIGY